MPHWAVTGRGLLSEAPAGCPAMAPWHTAVQVCTKLPFSISVPLPQPPPQQQIPGHVLLWLAGPNHNASHACNRDQSDHKSARMPALAASCNSSMNTKPLSSRPIPLSHGNSVVCHMRHVQMPGSQACAVLHPFCLFPSVLVQLIRLGFRPQASRGNCNAHTQTPIPPGKSAPASLLGGVTSANGETAVEHHEDRACLIRMAVCLFKRDCWHPLL